MARAESLALSHHITSAKFLSFAHPEGKVLTVWLVLPLRTWELPAWISVYWPVYRLRFLILLLACTFHGLGPLACSCIKITFWNCRNFKKFC